MLPDLLRLCFPAVVANASPLTVLPQFVEVLGKKLDKISAELDPTCHNVSCSTIKSHLMPFMHGLMQDRLRTVGSNASNTLLGSHGLIIYIVLGGVV